MKSGKGVTYTVGAQIPNAFGIWMVHSRKVLVDKVARTGVGKIKIFLRVWVVQILSYL